MSRKGYQEIGASDGEPSTCKKVASNFGAGLFASGAFFTYGALSGYFGTKILNAAGHSRYVADAAAEMTGFGTFLLAIPYLAIRFWLAAKRDDDTTPKLSCLIREFFLATTIEMAGSAIGGVIGKAADFNNGMSVLDNMASSAVGAGAIMAGASVLAAVCCFKR